MAGKRFNPSLIEHAGGYLLAFRNGWSGSEIWVVRLDARLRPEGGAWQLNLFHPREANYGREDPRLFWHDGRVHVSYIGVVGGHSILHTSQLYARLTDGLQVERVYYPHYDHRNAWEKNWQFFSHDNELYAVYSVAPHRVLRVRGDRAETAFVTPTPLPWGGGELRGGAAPVRVGDEYWSFFHDRIEVGGRRVYRAGLYTFEAAPPFRITRYVPEPILTARTDNKPEDQYAYVVWAGGAARHQGGWALACGAHDRWTELYRFDHAELERRLVRVRPAGGWVTVQEPHDCDVYRQVVEENEYRLPDRFAEGDWVIDIGGHIGTFAHACLSRGAGRVVSVEPDPAAFAALRANLERLHPGRHEAVRAAAWRSCPQAGTEAGPAGRDAPAVSLDELIAQAPLEVRLVKLDCEGAEWALLPASRLLGRVREIVGEYHLTLGFSLPDDLPAPSVEALTAPLERAGFVVELWPHPPGGTWEGGLFRARRAGPPAP